MLEERPSRLSRIAGAIRRFCTSPALRTGLLGGLCGSYLLIWCHAFLARWGTALPAVSGIVVAVALGFECAAWRRGRANSAFTSAWAPFALHLGLAGWTVAFPWLIAGAGRLLSRIPIETLAAPGMVWAVLLMAGIALLTLPAFLVGGVFFRSTADSPAHDSLRSAGLVHWLAGMAAGVVLGALTLAPWLGLETAAAAMAIIGAVIAFVHVLRPAAPLHSTDTLDSAPAPHAGGGAVGGHVWGALVCFLMGLSFAASQRLAHQLMPAVAYTLVIQWAALLLGTAWGLRGAQRRLAAGLSHRQSHRQVEGSACSWCAIVLSAIALGFPLLIDFVLLLNSHVASVPLMMAGRSVVAGLLAAPAGVCVGVLFARGWSPAGRDSTAAAPPRRATVGLFAAFAAGLILARWLGAGGLSPALLLIAAGAGIALLRLSRGGAVALRKSSWLPRAATATACVLPLLAVLAHQHETPARAARLLFSTNVFLAKQAGLNPELLTALDDRRLIEIREGQHGTYTLWKLRGVQFELRENGVPKAIVSGDARVSPQYSPEILQAVLPLVLHERPSRILLLGVNSGATLGACLRFPVLHVTWAEGDAALVELLRQRVWEGAGGPFADPRVTPLPLDPPLAVAGRHAAYDVIVSNPDQSALLSAAACFTAEFYADAARQLTTDGIFCQRFQALDYGAQPLAVAARTLQTAFRSVALVETALGEYALLGTNSQQGLVRDGLVDRLQAPQVGHVLAEVGWDWSMILNLNAYADAALAESAAAAEAPVNTAVNGQLAFRLPQEIIRWAPKSQEIQARFGPHATRFLAWPNVDGDDPDILRRLAEVSGQRNIVTEAPDQYWAYRKSVREQITERPRSLIVPVKGDMRQSVHPIDQRRLDYFQALGDAVKRHPPHPDDIRHVAEFGVPFDPLLSYFLHQEVAELYARLPERDYEAELPHRLHAIYFADGQDRSIRNVAAALVLLAEHPQALPEPIARWDHLNGLLQMMQLRWQNRGAVPPKSSRIVLNDIEKSIASVEAAFAAMDSMAREEQVPHADWDARRKYLERTLLRPLRTYRSQVLPHHLKRQRLAERTGEDVDALDASPATN